MNIATSPSNTSLTTSLTNSSKSSSKTSSKTSSKASSKVSLKDIHLECDNKGYKSDSPESVLEKKKRVFRIFNSIKTENCCDKKSCDNLHNIFEYLQDECYDAFKIDPHDPKHDLLHNACVRIKKKKENAINRYNTFSKTRGGKKSKKIKKNKTKKYKK